MLDGLEPVMRETCKQMGGELLEFGAKDDHLHLMLSIPQAKAISNFVGKLKGKSSYYLRKTIGRMSGRSYRVSIFGNRVNALHRVVARLWRSLRPTFRIKAVNQDDGLRPLDSALKRPRLRRVWAQ